MTLPVATTTITIWRRDSDVIPTEDPWDDPATGAVYAILDERVRAVISAAGGGLAGQSVGPGDSEVVRFALLADPCDLHYLDEIEDNRTGQRYAVEWAMASPGVGGQLASVKAGLTTRKGA